LPYDNDKLCDLTSLIFTAQLIHGHDNSILESVMMRTCFAWIQPHTHEADMSSLICKKERMMRTCLAWIQPHTHEAILKHIFNTVNSFLSSFTNYLDNCLLLNDLIIFRNYGDNEDVLDIKDLWKSSRDVPNKLEIQTNSEWRTSNPIQNFRI
jgi:hypothetical protein